MNKQLKQVLRFCISLKFGIMLLLAVAVYTIIGTVLPQNMPEEIYLQRYPSTGRLILAFSLHTAYSSGIFTVLLTLFSLNLLGCTLKSLRSQARQVGEGFFPPVVTAGTPIGQELEQDAAAAVFRKKRYVITTDEQGFKASKFRWGVFGSTITHVGIIIIVAAGIVGNIASREGFVNLIPGQEVSFDDKGFVLGLDNFYMTFLESGAVEQYYSELAMTDSKGKVLRETIWVNRPLRYHGINFYQASFGWVSNLTVVSSRTGEVLAERLLPAGQDYFFQPAHLTVVLYGYFPEMAIGHNQEPVSLSHREINPYYAVVLYEFNRFVGSYVVGPDERIRHKDWEISFTHSTLYTGILFRSDPSYPIALAGFIMIMIGMFVSFYLYPRFAEYRDGKLYTYSRKNSWVYHRTVKKYLGLS